MTDSANFAEQFRCAAAGLGMPKLSQDVVDLPQALESQTIVTTPESVEPEVSATSSQVTVRNLFQHPDVHPILLDLLLLREYGPEWFEWEPETLALRVRSDFSQDVSDLAMHKIQAAKTLHFNERFWCDWEVFVWCCMAFNGVQPDFEVMQVPTVSQCMIAADIALRIRTDVPWEPELKDYLEQVHLHDGIFCPTEPLDFVVVDGDEYPVDQKVIMERWPDVRKSGKAPPPTTVENEQLRRMLELHQYLEENRAELRKQLPLVLNV